jgi:hypothetical protein
MSSPCSWWGGGGLAAGASTAPSTTNPSATLAAHRNRSMMPLLMAWDRQAVPEVAANTTVARDAAWEAEDVRTSSRGELGLGSVCVEEIAEILCCH